MSQSIVGFSGIFKDSNYERSRDRYGFHDLFMIFHEELAALCDWNIMLDESLLLIARRRFVLYEVIISLFFFIFVFCLQMLVE